MVFVITATDVKLVLVIELTFIERVKVKMDRNMLAMLITKHYVDLNLDL